MSHIGFCLVNALKVVCCYIQAAHIRSRFWVVFVAHCYGVVHFFTREVEGLVAHYRDAHLWCDIT